MTVQLPATSTPQQSETESQKDSEGNYDPIQTCFEKVNFQQGQTIEFKVTALYDPSKFWIVTKHKELDVFQAFMFRFYYRNHTKYKMNPSIIKIDMYCVAFTNSSYYRGIILSIPPPAELNKIKVKIFYIDYGMMEMVDIENLYYLAEVCKDVPRFTVRAALAHICPHSRKTWTSDDVGKFYSLVRGRTFLGEIKNIDCKRQIVEIFMIESGNDQAIPIHEWLIRHEIARYCDAKTLAAHRKANQKLKVKYLYLFPSHEVLESGKVPFSVRDSEFLTGILSPEILYPQYFPSSFEEND